MSVNSAVARPAVSPLPGARGSSGFSSVPGGGAVCRQRSRLASTAATRSSGMAASLAQLRVPTGLRVRVGLLAAAVALLAGCGAPGSTGTGATPATSPEPEAATEASPTPDTTAALAELDAFMGSIVGAAAGELGVTEGDLRVRWSDALGGCAPDNGPGDGLFLRFEVRGAQVSEQAEAQAVLAAVEAALADAGADPQRRQAGDRGAVDASGTGVGLSVVEADVAETSEVVVAGDVRLDVGDADTAAARGWAFRGFVCEEGWPPPWPED